MKRTKYILFGFPLIVIVISGYFFWHSYTLKRDSAQYRTDVVRLGDVAQTVSAMGTLNPMILVNVGTQITGKVQKIYADFNDNVTSGQILLELDPALLKTGVSQSMAELNNAQAGLALAIANLERGKPLFKNKFISKQDWDQLLQIQISAAAEVRLAQAKLDKDRINLDYATIRSPVSGVVIDRQVDVGQTVTASFQTPILFQIAQDLGKMQIDSSFAEADIGDIKSGQEAVFTVDAFPYHNFYGKVKQIRLATTVQQNVVTYNVVVIVENKDGILLPGMTANINIKTSEHKNVLLVPNAALRFKPKNGKTKSNGRKLLKTGVIYKLVGRSLEPVSCKLGITDNSYTEVISDMLKAGDTVVIGYVKESSGNSSFKVKVF
ncbi:MAG: efflux RND transporter periplasmic adaptor subunit [Gammaproteobacteria bacterium]|nr:efflux RND transporter periplasmic adaptor subunit [Gammaproteobacteria bacterium]